MYNVVYSCKDLTMFSIIIPLYNKEFPIRQTLKSILLQTYTDFEVIIVDDGSTDDSVSVVNEVKDNRFKLIHQLNAGPSKARNTGLKYSKGEWILFLDADDDLLPCALEHFNNLTEKHLNYEFFACSSWRKSGKHKIQPFNFKEGLLKNPYAAMFLNYYCPRMGNFIVSRRVALLCPFDEKIRRFEDLEYFFRIFKNVKVYISPVIVMNENREYSEASCARQDIGEDFMGHIIMNGKSFWERLCLYRLFVEERTHYWQKSYEIYPFLYKRYDLLAFLKIVMWFDAHIITRRLLRLFLGKKLYFRDILVVNK